MKKWTPCPDTYSTSDFQHYLLCGVIYCAWWFRLRAYSDEKVDRWERTDAVARVNILFIQWVGRIAPRISKKCMGVWLPTSMLIRKRCWSVKHETQYQRSEVERKVLDYRYSLIGSNFRFLHKQTLSSNRGDIQNIRALGHLSETEHHPGTYMKVPKEHLVPAVKDLIFRKRKG